jgi:hypothetical protein
VKFAKLEQIARAMDAQELQDSLRSLTNDNRFAAVVRLIIDQKDLSSDGSSQLKFANLHGCLAHAAGVRYGMLELEGQIKQIADPPAKRGAQPPPEKR